MQYITRTDHTLLARYTISGTTYAVATTDILHAGVWHEAALTSDAALGADWSSQALRGGNIRLTVASRNDMAPAGIAAWQALHTNPVDGLQVTMEVLTTVTWADGTTQTFSEIQTLTCTARERAPGSITLDLTDIEDERLNALYPPETYTADEFPGLSPLDEGRAMPSVVGVVEKVPLGRITNASAWVYLAAKRCVPSGAISVGINTVYRGSSAADARLVTGTGFALHHVYRGVYFTAEQRDFSGAEYRLFADITSATFTAPEIIRQLLTDAGVTVDSASFSACETWAGTEGLLVDCDFGAWGQRTTRAILEDLLYVARATLTRLPDGSYGIVYDGPATTWADYDEGQGDAIEILSLTEASQPSKVGIRYRPSPRDPAGALQFTILRDVPGGTQGDERPRECRYIRRHEVADKTAYYYAQRAAHASRLRLRVYRTMHSLGDTLRITSAAWGQSASEWRVRRVTRIVGGVEVECERYSSALVTYVPGPLPGDPGADYTPDYSNTPPAAPTGLRITAGATALAGDGATTARVTVDALPPAVNWDRIQFSAVHNVTGEIPGIIRGEPTSGGRHGTILTGLRPGETYKLLAWAENAFGVQGVVQGTFNATAIGGGASVTTFTAPGYATLPANVTGISAIQGMGRIVNVSWNAVTTANLREYVLERRTGAGTYAEVWRGQARSYIDRDITYGTAVQYRVRARDLWGNFSAAYNTSVQRLPVAGTVVGGISGNDIGSNTVASGNRTVASSASTTVQWGTNEMTKAFSVPHGLGKTPLATVSVVGYGAPVITTLSNTVVAGQLLFVPTSGRAGALGEFTLNNTEFGDPHKHEIRNIPVFLSGAPVLQNSTVTINFW